MADKFRALKSEEIARLEKQGCKCEDWSLVQVAEKFDVSRVHTTTFGGEIRLGVFNKEIVFYGGVKKPTGISRATIGNCIIGDNVYIDQVKNYVANYEIKDDVVIENIDMLAVEPESSFGNGTRVAVLNEAGGREIPIYDRLSAHTAYLIAFYRHRPELVKKLEAMVADYCKKVTSPMGVVGKKAWLMNCGSIRDVKIGEFARIEGVDRLERGSINSCQQDPVYIGPNVTAEDFIICSGARVTDGTLISKCFVGQGCELAKQYSAENSVFFANCGGYHGEACSIFAGPYTVTHHKATLLIAGLFSFLNAGSGSNQSNHMYKLGPVHQGVVERGSKTGSDSYMLWPAKVGAFSVIMGRHYSHCDTSELPFSYLIEHEDESILAPGANLRSVGTVRDARKWPKRDRRKDSDKLDLINFKLLSPYTTAKMIAGSDVLCRLISTCGETAEYYTYKGVKIKNSSLKHGLDIYRMAIDKYLGNCLISKIKSSDISKKADLSEAMKFTTRLGRDKWLDLAGLLAPQEVVEALLSDIENSFISDLSQLERRFAEIQSDFADYEWSWASGVLEAELGKKIENITVEDIINTVTRWQEAVVGLDKLLYEDSRKEFGATAKIGYGVDGDVERQSADFAAVRGTFEDNGVVKEIEAHIRKKSQLADEIISQMQALK